MSRVFNFSAGPACLPVDVLEKAASEMTDFEGSGMGVMEMSHRSKDYLAIFEKTEALVRELMGVPDNYKVLFQQGGATLQFTMAPMNLAGPDGLVEVAHTGAWSKKAIAEAKKQCNVNVVFSSEESNFNRVPTQEELQLSGKADYVHITSNNTIYGTEYHYTPDTGGVPLAADMSSNILSKPMDVSKYGLIYAGAQKNLGPAGVTLVILRDDLIGKREGLPLMLDYKAQADKDSMLNTPPTYAIYLLGLVLDWVKAKGGVSAMEANNIAKAEKLYAAIDGSSFYGCPTEVASRSRMNVPFTLANPDLDGAFLAQAKDAGLVTLKGHRSVGGMRASIYNAMPMEGIDKLVGFMADFEKANG